MSEIKGGVGHQGHPVLHITAPAGRHPGGLNIQKYGKTPSCVLGPLVSPGLSLPALCLFRGPCYAGTWQTLYKYLLTNRLRFFLFFPFPTFCPRDTTLFPSIPPLPPAHQPLSQAATFPGVQASTGSMLSSARSVQPLQEFPLPGRARARRAGSGRGRRIPGPTWPPR